MTYSYETECQGKLRHDSKRDAKRAVKNNEQRIGDRLCAYRCSWCGWFHIGHRVPAAHRPADA